MTDKMERWQALYAKQMEPVKRAGYDEKGFPLAHTALWYRLRALGEMTKEQMESMLAFLSGYNGESWDAAYAQSGAKPIELAEDDPDYWPARNGEYEEPWETQDRRMVERSVEHMTTHYEGK